MGTIGIASIAGCTGGAEEHKSPKAEPAEFEIVDTVLETQEIEAGGTAEVIATIQNTGGQRGDFIVELTADGEIIESKDITLSEGEEQTVTFTQTFQEVGSYNLQINEANVETLSVDPNPTDDGYFKNLTTTILEERGIQVASIEVANGRDNGGQKGVITTYQTSSINEVLDSEMVTFLATFTKTVELGWDIDAMTVVVGNQEGTTIGVYVIEAEWAQSKLNGDITTEEYISKTRNTFTYY